MIALDGWANGTIEKWKAGGSSPSFMTACGWNKKSSQAGDVITVVEFRNGAKHLANQPARRIVTARQVDAISRQDAGANLGELAHDDLLNRQIAC
jgi:hypothetical protein